MIIFLLTTTAVALTGQLDSNHGDQAESYTARGKIQISTTEIGYPNNQGDLAGRGSVGYTYAISRFEITQGQYAVFLNSVSTESDPHFLYHPKMGLAPYGGISRIQLDDGSFEYRVSPLYLDKPVNFVSWIDAARFANWMHNDQPVGLQNEFTTETGAYDLLATPFPIGRVLRSATARWAIPSYSEWYKAAYFDPSKPGNNPWWRFATRSDQEPLPSAATASGDLLNPGAGVCNFDHVANWNGSQTGNISTVGSAGFLSATFFGSYDLNGNVAEFIEKIGCVGPDCGRYVIGGSATCNVTRDNRTIPCLRSEYGRTESPQAPEDEYFNTWFIGFRLVKLADTHR